GQRAGHFQQAVRQRGLAVVDVRDDAEVSNELRVHFSRLPICSIAGGIRMARRFFRQACCIRTSDTRSAKTVPYKHSVCHNSKAASACTPITGEKKSGVTRTEPGNCGSFLAETQSYLTGGFCRHRVSAILTRLRPAMPAAET